ncbi:TPA: hypothetical protein DDW69_02120 [candidate division CPR2 bacterium]|uniref:Uncharacterized protein n=1 Tax=candidate division CPR2 bacterium GW2011_GWC1_41_48 TaxID=1618344 RepID=A0A0G0WCN6_UNCC2|nr:MAG: hypothetical protein UT47_C0001G0227 [candidate division CPR2 bacterium GW2011_GWC2_39_35]KKR28120.1 MAG: hypothetical protein UT60_C0027G0010 [candidate division CPR2 bacterium GW2011_GWD2_39_7]KKR29555.1 MAG: hypothetical protein UT59_C0005G0010 [candidate division CPR2 bacterium GW2011_GWD1_39_7]KKS09822.1 MAG: hypothetical protein UU65_C0001G0227 [candidate division CPR2 bacterium GW2011_GWC1_41_48]OGB55861.1 MAG: hypothetical protein A2Y27_00365 [candidate division CPR2 bacterium G
MAEKVLKKEEWKEYLSDFSSNYQTRYSTLSVEEPGLEETVIFEALPLIAIEPDLKNRTPHIEIIAGDLAGENPDNITHTINNPQEITVDENDGVENIIIITEEGRITLEII